MKDPPAGHRHGDQQLISQVSANRHIQRQVFPDLLYCPVGNLFSGDPALPETGKYLRQMFTFNFGRQDIARSLRVFNLDGL